MKIIVFGATGGVGQHVVTLAQAAGHDVTAFVRTPEKLAAAAGTTVVATRSTLKTLLQRSWGTTP